MAAAYAAGVKSLLFLAASLASLAVAEVSAAVPMEEAIAAEKGLPAGVVARLGGHPMVHPEWVRTMEFSTDSKLLLTTDDHNAWVWDAATGRMIHRIEMRLGYRALSPDGKTLAFTVRGPEAEVRLVDLASGKTKANL